MRQWISRTVGCAAFVLAGHAVAQSVSLEDLARHMQYHEAKLSPDGKSVAVTVSMNDTPVLALINLETHKGATIHPREHEQVVDFWWVNNQRVLYTEGTKVAGFDQPFSTGEIFAVNADGGGATELFGYRAGWGKRSDTLIPHAEAERASGYIIARLRDDPNHVLIGVNAWSAGADGDFTDIYRMDVRDGTKSPVTHAPLRNAHFLVDHDGALRFAYGPDLHDINRLYYRGADGGDWTLLSSDTDGHGIPQPIAFRRDNKEVYMTCVAPGMVGAVCPWNVATRTMLAPVWTDPAVTASHYILSLDGLDLVGLEADPGLPAVSVIDEHSQAIQLLASVAAQREFQGQRIRIVSGSDDGSAAIVLVSSDRDPGTFYLWQKDGGKFTVMFKRAGWIDPSKMGATRPIAFKARDGLTIHGYVTTPPGQDQAKHLPMVVYVHGGPFGVRDDWQFDPYVQMMATRGYAVLQVNYRGSGGYGRGFERAGYREWGGKMQDDVTDATRWAIDQGIASAGRVCIFGGSYGGYAALEGAAKEQDLYRCTIGYVGVYDLALMYSRGDIHESLLGKSYLHEALGDDPAMLAAALNTGRPIAVGRP